MKLSSYDQIVDYLESDLFIHPSDFTVPQGKDLLERFRYLLGLLGNPERNFKSIVVSGTSGKGSTTNMIAAILTQSGYKTGMTISPHLEHMRERLVINSRHIAEKKFIDLITRMIPHIKKMEQSPYGYPSYFEILLAASFVYFSEEKVDIAVIEVGLEGRFDGTNLLNPLMFVLTNISLDHTDILGDVVEKIALEATERISYLPTNASVVTGVSQKNIQDLVNKQAKKSGAKVFLLHKDFDYAHIQEMAKGSLFSFYTKNIFLHNISLSLIGSYQIQNAALAIETITLLREQSFVISEQAIRDALSQLTVPGRFELLSFEGQKIVFDGAHNVAKMESFLGEVQKLFSQEKKIFLVAFSTGHNAKEMLTAIAHTADAIILTEFYATSDLGKNRIMSVEKISEFLHSPYVYTEKNSTRALKTSLQIAKKERGVIFVTGSLFLIGEVKKQLHLLKT